MIKRRGKSKIENLTPDHKSFESRGQMRSNWSVLYTIGKIFWREIKYCPCTFKKKLIWKKMSIQHFETIRVPILGFPLGSFGGKWHLDVIPTERHKVSYRVGSGASSQRLQAVWSLCLKLSLLSPLLHFHSICTNRPLYLFV